MRDNRLRWFKHVYHRSEDAVVRRSDMIMEKGSIRRGRPKLTFEEVVSKGSRFVGYHRTCCP